MGQAIPPVIPGELCETRDPFRDAYPLNPQGEATRNGSRLAASPWPG